MEIITEHIKNSISKFTFSILISKMFWVTNDCGMLLVLVDGFFEYKIFLQYLFYFSWIHVCIRNRCWLLSYIPLQKIDVWIWKFQKYSDLFSHCSEFVYCNFLVHLPSIKDARCIKTIIQFNSKQFENC